MFLLVARSSCTRAFLVTEVPQARIVFVHFSPRTSASGVGWGRVRGANNITWHLHTHVMLRYESYLTNVSC